MNRKPKKIIRIFLVVLLILLMMMQAGCGKKEKPQEPAAQEQSASAEEQATKPEQATEPEEEPATEPEPEEEPEQATEPESEPAAEPEPEPAAEPEPEPEQEDLLDPDGWYYSKEEVALYLYTYGELPGNFITKKEAQKLGWSGGSLEKFAPGKVIGGDYFGNYEGNLPEKKGREYHECDIDTLGKKKRGAKRIVFSNDGLIYYTEDHYENFELLYGEEDG